MILRCLLLFAFSLSASAAPRTIEVWFVSNAKVSQLLNLLNRPEHSAFAPVVELQCQPMGDYCFDPQHGLYKKDDSWGTVSAEKIEKDGPSIPAGKSLDQNLINCDPKNYFDIFCGKARPEKKAKSVELELWIDTSSSMREFDFQDKQGDCFRKSLVRRLDEKCGFNEKMRVMTFDTSIKEAGSMDGLCENRGLNDHKRLIDWIERSDAKHLVVITDIYEFHKEFSDYIESKNGNLKGDKDPLTAAQLLELVDPLAKSCK